MEFIYKNKPTFKAYVLDDGIQVEYEVINLLCSHDFWNNQDELCDFILPIYNIHV